MSSTGQEQQQAGGDEELQQNPDQLEEVVKSLLDTMQGKFQQMSEQIIGRLDDMGKRVDDLENNISELMEQLEAKEEGGTVKKEQK